MVQLMRDHPRDAARHLAPLFRAFGQEAAIIGADLRLAWQVLADLIPPDESLRPQVENLIAELGSDDFRRRQMAFVALRELDGPAALLLMRHPPVVLSPEQRAKIDAFLAEYRPLDPDEAARHRLDPQFLLTCIAYSPEPAVRLAAASQLEAVSAEAQKLATTEDPVQRREGVDLLRDQVPERL